MRRFVLAMLCGLCGPQAALAAVPSPPPRYPAAFSPDPAARFIGESDTDAALGGVQIFVAAGLDRETAATSGVSALLSECILRTPVAAGGNASRTLPLREAVAESGGNLTYTVDGRSVHYYVEGRSEKLSALVALLGKALAAPDFTPATVAAGRAALSVRIGELEGNALSVGIEMFRRSYYATSAGQPALGSTTTLAGLSSLAVADFYRATYKRDAVRASAVGRLAPDLSAAVAALWASLPEGPVAAVPERAKPIPAEAPRIVAHRDVAAPLVVVGFAAPSPSSSDFGAMLVLQALLSDAFERNSATSLGFVEKSVGAFYLYDSTPASLVVYVNGTQIDPSLGLRELLGVAHSLAGKPLAADQLRRFKMAAEGQFLTDSVTLSDRSYLLGTFAAQGLGTDSINAALAALERTTAADVERAARTYLRHYIVALVLPRATGR